MLLWHTVEGILVIEGVVILTEGAGGKMVFVKVRETYDLHTIRNKMSVIGVHTPDKTIVQRNYPGLLMQCKGYRPVSVDIRLACASMLPLDPQGIGLTEGDVAPEDVFNPILYKTVSNRSMSQIEMFIHESLGNDSPVSAKGASVDATNDGVLSNDFNLYYGLLSNTHEWKHANPQQGLEMRDVRPLVYEMNYTVGEATVTVGSNTPGVEYFKPDGTPYIIRSYEKFLGKAKPMPMLWTTQVLTDRTGENPQVIRERPGFSNAEYNWQTDVPAPKIFCALLCIPPSRLHQLFYRMVVEWTLEFSQIRSMHEIVSWNGLSALGASQHVQDYSYDSKDLLKEETSLVDTSEGTGITKVM